MCCIPLVYETDYDVGLDCVDCHDQPTHMCTHTKQVLSIASDLEFTQCSECTVTGLMI